MSPSNAVEALQEADETVQQHPLSAAAHSAARPLPVNVPVPLAVCHPPSPTSRQQEEAGPPELQRVDQTVEGRILNKLQLRV